MSQANGQPQIGLSPRINMGVVDTPAGKRVVVEFITPIILEPEQAEALGQNLLAAAQHADSPILIAGVMPAEPLRIVPR